MQPLERLHGGGYRTKDPGDSTARNVRALALALIVASERKHTGRFNLLAKAGAGSIKVHRSSSLLFECRILRSDRERRSAGDVASATVRLSRAAKSVSNRQSE